MAGDVNIFLHEPEEEGDAADLECEVMIAGASLPLALFLCFAPACVLNQSSLPMPLQSLNAGKSVIGRAPPKVVR